MFKQLIHVLLIALVFLAVSCSKKDDSSGLSNSLTPGTASQLAGTKWIVGDMTVTFKDESTFLLETEAIRDDHPNGVEGKFVVRNGIVEANALDQVRTGTWDGEALIVDGAEAKKIQ